MKKLVGIAIFILLCAVHEEVVGLVLLMVLSGAGLIAILNADQRQKGKR